MKTYIVKRGSGGQVGCLVDNGNGRNATLLVHCVYHSPSGFETGYAGSGPADLALSILANYFGATPAEIRKELKSWSWEGQSPAARALKLHQDFKFRFIAARKLAPAGSYEILGAEIASWLADREREVA